MSEYIERETALEALLNEMCGTGYQSQAMRAVEFIPAADVEPVVHAAWVGKPPKSSCSACGKYAKWEAETGGWWSEALTPRCPHCGAKMDLQRASK